MFNTKPDNKFQHNINTKTGMIRCPKCHRFGIERNSGSGVLECLWSDCGYKPTDEEVRKAKYPIKFHKFIKAIKRKMRID